MLAALPQVSIWELSRCGRASFFFLSFFFALILFVKAAGVDDGRSGSVVPLQVTSDAPVEVKQGQ